MRSISIFRSLFLVVAVVATAACSKKESASTADATGTSKKDWTQTQVDSATSELFSTWTTQKGGALPDNTKLKLMDGKYYLYTLKDGMMHKYDGLLGISGDGIAVYDVKNDSMVLGGTAVPMSLNGTMLVLTLNGKPTTFTRTPYQGS
ncbi:MAG: hypothetical protein ACR2M1_17005 [Gemmatimonadaceae bacterium]